MDQDEKWKNNTIIQMHWWVKVDPPQRMKFFYENQGSKEEPKISTISISNKLKL